MLKQKNVKFLSRRCSKTYWCTSSIMCRLFKSTSQKCFSPNTEIIQITPQNLQEKDYTNFKFYFFCFNTQNNYRDIACFKRV